MPNEAPRILRNNLGKDSTVLKWERAKDFDQILLSAVASLRNDPSPDTQRWIGDPLKKTQISVTSFISSTSGLVTQFDTQPSEGLEELMSSEDAYKTARAQGPGPDYVVAERFFRESVMLKWHSTKSASKSFGTFKSVKSPGATRWK